MLNWFNKKRFFNISFVLLVMNFSSAYLFAYYDEAKSKQITEECDPKSPGYSYKTCDPTTCKKRTWKCDIINPVDTLRYGRSYIFNDYFINKDKNNIRVFQFSSSFTEQGDYNWATTIPNFKFSAKLKEKDYIIAPLEKVEILKATNKYDISYHPEIRTNRDIYITYDIVFQDLVNGKIGVHKICWGYSITWCGDGIIDKEYKEECDPKASGWNSSTCNPKTCKKIY